MEKVINVLVVDDSPVIQELMKHIINADPQLTVVAVASNGEEAVAAAEKYKPDVITMDLTMPKMDGMEATRQIMETCPAPIVIVTGSNRAQDMSHSVKMIQSGALAVLLIPHGIGHPAHDEEVEKLISTLKLMSEVKVVRRIKPKNERVAEKSNTDLYRAKTLKPSQIDVVAIGVSTGGPPLLQKIIARLPKNFAVPVLVVQHMAPNFIAGFASWLEKNCQFPVHVASQNETLRPGHVYLAPDFYQMEVSSKGKIHLVDQESENGHKPAVSVLFKSVANIYGKKAVGILLTGMGKDGATELKLIKDQGGVTIAQSKESCAVFGMPGEAIKLDGATYIFTPEEIIEFLSVLT